MYDAHVLPQAKEWLAKANELAATNLEFKQGIDLYEKPAIEFENLIMGKYKNEPPRTLDYARSGVFDEAAWEVDKRNFIESATSHHLKHAQDADLIRRASLYNRPGALFNPRPGDLPPM